MTGLEILTQCAWKGSILLLAGFAAGAMLRHRSAALRHTVWTACFAALLTLPAAILVMPHWGVFGHPGKPAIPAPAGPLATVEVIATSAQPVAATPVNVPLLVWMAGAGMVAVWFLLGTLRTSWMVRRAAPSSIDPAQAATLGIRRRVRVLDSDATPMPLTWGLLRPVVVLPKGAAEWPEARLRSVMLHELTHVRRWDLLAQGIAQAACCFYWFHPLAWIAARQLRKEREQACDDAVLARGIPAPEYAGHLMDLVRAMAARRNTWTHAPAMAEISGLEARVRAMLDPKRDRRPLNARKLLAIASAGGALLLPLAALSETTQSPATIAAPPVQAVPAPIPAAAPPLNVPLRLFKRKTPTVASLVEAAPAPAPPQATSGSLTGIVRDPSGAVIPGCTVVVRNVDGTGEQTLTTDAAGQYRIDTIMTGRYSLRVDASGFAVYKLDQLPITAGNVAQINVNLQIGAISETVTIQGKRSAVVTPKADVSGRIRVGGMVQMARLVRQTRPVYPAELQQLGIEGTVKLTAVISKDGIPTSLHVVPTSVDPRLVPLALDAVGQWRYQPVLLNGEPVETVTSIDVNFTLDQ